MKKCAFTLAEVLITLGIIGVVAAMTIPTLIANIRSQQYRSRLKKAVSTLSQAAKMSQAQYGFDYAGITKVCGPNAKSEHPDSDMTICAILNGTLTGATYYENLGDIKMSKNGKEVSYSFNPTYPPYSSGSNYYHAYVLSDGTIVAFHKKMGTFPCSVSVASIIPEGNNYKQGTSWCFGFIDVNGVSLPNKVVSCSSGSNSLKDNDCIVRNDQHLSDVYTVRFYNGLVELDSPAGRYVLNTAK